MAPRGGIKAYQSGAATTILRKEKVEQKLGLTKQSQIQLEQHGQLKDAFAVASVNGQRTVTYVFHHPIGITDLDDEDWVCSLAEDIPHLLSRTKDPRQKEVDQARVAIKDAYLTSKLLLQVNEGEYCYPDAVFKEKKVRRALLRQVNNEYEAEARSEKLKLINEYGSDSDLVKNFHPSKSREDFMPAGMKDHEAKIAKELSSKEATEFLRSRDPQKFRTKGGVYENKPQVACRALKGISDRARAFDRVNRTLKNAFDTEYVDETSLVVVPDPPSKT